MTKTFLAIVAGLMMTLGIAVGSAAAAGDATVYVVHGIPGTTVDVYVNNKLTLGAFKPGTVTDALMLPAGDYQLAIRTAGAAPNSDPLLSASATLKAGDNVSIVAYLDASGKPALKTFANDASSLPAGQARLTVRHVAAAPTVDIKAGDKTIVPGLAAGAQATTAVPAGDYSVSVVPAGSDKAVLGPASLSLKSGMSYVVYAIGSAQQNSLDLLVQSMDVGSAGGMSVGAGGAGLVGQASTPVLLAIAGLAVIGLFVTGRSLVAAPARVRVRGRDRN